jgi:hypothetical protein
MTTVSECFCVYSKIAGPKLLGAGRHSVAISYFLAIVNSMGLT